MSYQEMNAVQKETDFDHITSNSKAK